jgi:hypothetical protein
MMPSHCRRSDWLGISSHSGVHTGRSDTWVTVLISGSGSGWLAPANATPSRKAASATAHHQRWYQGNPLAFGGRGGGGVPQPAGGCGCWLTVLPPSEHLDPDGGSNAMGEWRWPGRRKVTIAHQIRRLVLYVHAVRLRAVCAAQVSGRVQRVLENPSGDGWWTATRTAMTAGSNPQLT